MPFLPVALVTACCSPGKVSAGADGQQEGRDTAKSSCRQESGVWGMETATAVLFTPRVVGPVLPPGPVRALADPTA